MEEKKEIRIKFSTVIILILTLVIVGLVSYIIWSNNMQDETLKNEKVNDVLNENVDIAKKIILNKTYTVDKVTIEDTGVSNEECGIKFENESQFYFYLGWGFGLKGSYKIENNTVICNTTIETGELMEDNNINGELIFNIENDILKLTKRDVKNTKAILDNYSGIEIGMTYSVKEENKVDEDKVETSNLKGEKLVQFDREFYKLEDIAKEYRHYQNIKNYKDFNYDLDGDGIDDKVTLSHKTEKTNNGLGSYYEEDVYSVKLNDKVFSTGTLLDDIYIVDLNESDNNIEVVIFDDGPSDDPNYTIYSKEGNKMVEIECMSGYPLRTDKNGTVIVDSSFNVGENGNTSPTIYFDYYIIRNNKVERKFLDVNKVKNIDLQTESLYFSKDLNNLDKFYQEGGLDINKLEEFNIEQLDKNTTFKILDFEISKDENDIEEYKIYVELSDGRQGYIFHIQLAG